MALACWLGRFRCSSSSSSSFLGQEDEEEERRRVGEKCNKALLDAEQYCKVARVAVAAAVMLDFLFLALLLLLRMCNML